MAETARIGILIPTAYGQEPPRPQQMVEFCQTAERLGFDSLWSVDRLFHRINILEAYTILTWAAAVTQRIRIGSAVILSTLRLPVWLAKEAATLDYLSGGRLTLGISLGGMEPEYAAIGVPTRQRTRRLEETIAILRRLWSEDNVTWQGRYYDLRGVTILPKPVQRPLPILIGASAEAGLRRAGELADGWIAGSGATVDQFRQAWHKVQEFARGAGRDPSQLQSGKLLYLCVDDNRDRARERVKAFVDAYYAGRLDVDAACVFGPADVCAERAQAFIDAGVDTLVLAPPGPDIGQLEALAQKVVPQLKLSR
ncbi:MAG: LLM class flavin-dependent oxidoreductase [Dehalococcoidia bacterium]